MKLVRFLGFFVALCLFAFQTIAQSNEALQAEKKIGQLEYLYLNGSYNEVNAEALKFSKLWKNNLSVPEQLYIQCRIYQLKSIYSILEFEKANILEMEIVKEIDVLTTSESKAWSLLYLTAYYNQIGSFHKASLLYTKIISSSLERDPEFQISREIETSRFLAGQQNIVLAREAIKKAVQILNDSTFSSDITNVSFINRTRAKLLNLDLGCLIENGSYAEAEQKFLRDKKSILTMLSATDPEYSRFLELEADLADRRQQYKKAYRLYQDSYKALLVSDYNQHKIYLLAKIVALSCLVGDANSYDQYMRRLQLFADRNIYRFNSFQLAHTYAEAFSFYSNGNYSGALLKLKKIDSKYPAIPANHIFRSLAFSLEELIYEEDGQLLSSRKIVDTLLYSIKVYKGEDTPAYFNLLLKRATIQSSCGEHPIEIEKDLSQRYLALSDRIDSVSSISYSYFSLMAKLNQYSDEFQSAKANSNHAKQIALALYDSLSWEYSAACLIDLNHTIWAGAYKEALEEYQIVIKYEGYLKNINNSFQYINFHTVAGISKDLGDLSASRNYSLKGMKLLESESRNQRISFSVLRQQAASAYIDISNLFAAEKLLLQLLKKKKEKFGIGHLSLLALYKELTHLYILNGNFSQADKMLSDYLKLSKTLYGERSIVYNEGVFLSGQYFVAIGNLKKAKENFESCLRVQRNFLGENHLLVAATYLELASINVKLDPENFVQNEQSFHMAGTIVEATIGRKNQLFAQYLQMMAEFYTASSKFELATEVLIEAKNYWESKLGARNVHSADIEMLLGKIAYLKSSYKEAEQYYNKAKDLYGSIFSEEHPSFALANASLAKVSFMLHDPDKALSIMEVCIPKYLAYVEKYFPGLSFQEKSRFWVSMKEEFEFYDFLVLSALPNTKGKFNGNVYNSVIATKALLLSSDIKLRKQINSSGDSTLIQLFEEWISQKELLTVIVSYSKEQMLEQGLDQKIIELKMESLEKEMSTRSELFQSRKNNRARTWKEIQSSLKPHEYAVEIVRYRYFDKSFKDSVLYAALIVGNETREYPEVVILPDGNKMESRYLQYYKNAVVFMMEDEYSYSVFWKSIKEKIPDNSTIYLSSDGVYNQLNIEMFFNSSKDRFVLDENQLVQLTNTKDIVEDEILKRARESKKATGEFVLCGNPSFYIDFERKQSIKSLPGAENEVKSIKELLDRSGKKNLTYLDKNVTEELIKTLKSPVALHIATHGYFKEALSETDNFSSNPLLNSGLMLTGAGNIVDGTNSYVNSVDGILTAYEVINMQLDQTEIVILSACETGKGMLQAGEGVYGLQRSFLIAGADCVILSLFKVNDEVTKELMIQYYSNWLQTDDKRRAFMDAKKTIKEKYKSPIYWGAFIMIEGKNQRKKIAD